MNSLKALISLITLCICLTLTACDSGSKTKKEEVNGVIPQAQLKAMEKAKEVEDVLADAEEQRRKQIEQQQ